MLVILGVRLDRHLKVESSLSHKGIDSIIRLLLENLDIFFWVMFDIPGMDPSFIFYKLAVNPECTTGRPE